MLNHQVPTLMSTTQMARICASITFALLASCGEHPEQDQFDCDRTGCNLLTKTSDAHGTGVSGVIAYASHLSGNGCNECPLADTTLKLWNATGPVPEAVRATTLIASPPDSTTQASAHYELALSPGYQLLCVRSDCIGFLVQDEEMLTVNIKQRFGATSYFVARPGDVSPTEYPGFHVDALH
jgi:hypothetical protein